jgi:hypothetical protein
MEIDGRASTQARARLKSRWKTLSQKKRVDRVSPERLERDRQRVRPILREALCPSSPRLRRNDLGALVPDYPNYTVRFGLTMKALGTNSGDFEQGILEQIEDLLRSPYAQGKLETVNYLYAAIKGMRPQNETETMLGFQMVAINHAVATALNELKSVARGDPEAPGRAQRLDSAVRNLNSLARTYVQQLDTLKRLRSKGEQQITVQHVTVTDNSQAIVGDVTNVQAQTSPGSASANCEPIARTKP